MDPHIPPPIKVPANCFYFSFVARCADTSWSWCVLLLLSHCLFSAEVCHCHCHRRHRRCRHRRHPCWRCRRRRLTAAATVSPRSAIILVVTVAAATRRSGCACPCGAEAERPHVLGRRVAARAACTWASRCGAAPVRALAACRDGPAVRVCAARREGAAACAQ